MSDAELIRNQQSNESQRQHERQGTRQPAVRSTRKENAAMLSRVNETEQIKRKSKKRMDK